MTRSVRLYLDQFGRDALTHFARRRKDSEGAVLRTAALYYLADGEAERPAWRAPRFVRSAADAPGRGLEIDLDDDIWVALHREAGRQGVEPERLAEHAVLYFLADLDSGRIAGRLGAAVEDGSDLAAG
jgi:hypothetical protein